MNKVKRARKKLLKTLKDLREGKIDLDKVPVPGISGKLKGSSEQKPQALVGKRVQHVCEEPDCPLKGRVVRVDYFPDRTFGGEKSDWWALVRWDGYGNVPDGHTQHVPIHRIKVIEKGLLKERQGEP